MYSSRKRKYDNVFNEAYNFATKANQAYNKYFSNTETQTGNPSSKKGSAASDASLAKFGKTRYKKNLEMMYARQGFVTKREGSGTVSARDVAYVGHSSYAINDLMNTVWTSIVRKLFRKAGFDVDNPNTPLPDLTPWGPTVANTWRIVLARSSYNRTNGTAVPVPDQNNFEYNVVATDTLITLGNQLATACTNFFGISGSSAFNLNQNPIYLQLLYQPAGDAGYTPMAMLNLLDETIHIYGKSHLFIQNRTRGEGVTAGEETIDTDVTTRMPLIGKRMNFKHGCPIARNDQVQALCYVDVVHGLCGVGTENVIGAAPTPLREIPNPGVFKNLDKFIGISLQPGQIKSGTVYHQWKGTLMQMYKIFRNDAGSIAPARQGTLDGIFKMQYMPGSSELYALEEPLNMTSTVSIRIAYEYNREIGAFSVTHKKKAPLANFNQTVGTLVVAST